MIPEWIREDLKQSENSWQSAHQALPRIIIENTKDEVLFGVEVGIAYGSMCIALLDFFPNLTLLGVDPFEPYDSTDIMSRSREDMDHLSEFTENRILGRFGDRFRLLRKPSLKAAFEVHDSSLDFVFIDACHQYEAVRDDIRAWIPKIRPGGVMAGHDYGEVWDGVKKAVDEFFESRNQSFFVDQGSMIWGSQMP